MNRNQTLPRKPGMRLFRCLLFYVSLFWVCLVHGAAYVPPVAIPAPSFGIEQTIASVYGSNTFYTYWIDNTHPSATDTGNPKGTPAQPRLTIPAPLLLSPGDVVQLRGGPYTPVSDRVAVLAEGTAAQPIFISGASTNDRVRLTKFIHVQRSSYLILENITLSSSISVRPLSNNVPNHHVCVRGCEIAGSNAFESGSCFSVDAGSFSNSIIHDVVFYNNLAHDKGDWRNVNENDNHAFVTGNYATNIWILNNTAYHMGGDGVQCSHNGQFTTHHVYIGGNYFHDNRENAVDIKQANNVVVSGNRVHGFRPVSSAPGEAIVAHFDPTNIVIINNEVFDSELGIVSSGSVSNYVIGNVIYNIRHTETNYNPASAFTGGTGIRMYACKYTYIYNNTIVDYDTGIALPGGTSFRVFNNVLSGRKETNAFEFLFLGVSEVEMDYNLFNGVITSTRIGWGGSGTPRTLSQLILSFNRGLNCIEADPLFANPPQDYSIRLTSPCIDKGADLATYADFTQVYGQNIAFDFLQRPRKRGGFIDIGAYEGPRIVRPRAAQNLKVE